ncbi:MAG: translocation/assembly module TamB domain-containing protein [Polyangiales bacterium]
MSDPQEDRPPTLEGAQPALGIIWRSLYAMGWLWLAIVCLLVSALLHLESTPARNFACELGRELGSEAIAGSIDFQCVDIDLQLPLSVTAWVEDVEIFGADGELVIAAEALNASAALMPLLSGELLLSDVAVQSPRVSLATNADGELRIAGTFVPVGPTESDGEPSTFKMRLDGAISGASVRDVPGIDVQVDALALGVRVEVEGGSVEVHTAQRESANVSINGEDYGALTGLAYDAALRDEGSMDAALQLSAGGGRIDVGASMPWVDDTVGALDGHVEGALNNAMLRPFTGLDLVGGPTNVALALRSAPSTEAEEPTPFDTFAAEGEIGTPGGDVAVEASVDVSGPLQAALAIQSSQVQLGEALAPSLGVAESVGFDLEVTAEEEGSSWGIEVRGDDIVYDTWQVQSLVAAATIDEDEVVLSHLDLPVLSEGGHMNVSGRFGFDGSLDASIDADLPRLSRQPSLSEVLPGVGGRARIEANVSLRDERIDARADVDVSGFRLRDLRVTSASVRATASGPLTSPTLDAHVRAGSTRAYGIDLTRVELHGTGRGPYRIRGRLEGPAQFVDRSLAVDVNADLGVDHGVQATGNVRMNGLFPRPVSVDIQRFATTARGLSVAALALRAPGVLNADMQGQVAFRGRSDFSFNIEDVNFEPIGELLGFPIEGNLVAQGEFHGSIARPALRSRGSLSALRYLGLELASLDWNTSVEQRDGKAAFDLDVEAVGDVIGRIDVKLKGAAPSANLSGDWRHAPLEAHVALSGTEIAPLVAGLPLLLGSDALPVLSGTLGVELRARGTYLDPQSLDAFVAVSDLAYPDLGVLVPRVEFETGLHDGNLISTLALREPSSSYLQLRAALTFDRLAWEHSPRDILQEPWTLDVRVPERSVGDFPVEILDGQLGRVGLQAHFAGQGRSSSLGGADGTVSASASYPAGAGDGESCRLASTMLALEGRLERGIFNVESRLRSAGTERAVLSATMPLPLDRWAVETPERLPPIDADLAVRELQVSSVPVACAELEGEVNLAARLENIFGEEPLLDLRASIAGLQSTSAADDAPPANFDVEASASASRASVSLRLAGEHSELFSAEGEVPMAMDEELRLPLPNIDQWQGRAEFNHAPLALLAAPVSLIGSPRGHFSGEVRARADEQSGVSVRGEVRLEELGFTLRDPLLRVESLGGRITLDEDHLSLHDVGFEDREGTIVVNGQVGMDGWNLGRVEATAALDEFPFRVEGVVYAKLDTQVDITGEFGDPLSEFDVGLRDAAIQISPDVGRQVQSLSQHPDVIYDDEADDDGFAALLGTTLASARADEHETRIRLHSNPFYVRREDFSVQVVPDLNIIVDHLGLRLEGDVEIRRGFLSIVGKQFDFERSELRFAGGRDLNPRIDITAVHELSNRETVTVQLSGDLFSLQLAFSSSDPSAETEAEILALLIGGGTNDDAQETEAREDVLGFVTGLTAGALSSLTRRTFGEFLPVFGIESGTAGNRIRAAIPADRLIPDFLSDVVIGAHIEGYVGEQNNGDAGRSFAAGVELELLFPHSLLLNTRYQQGNTWGLELRWEP